MRRFLGVLILALGGILSVAGLALLWEAVSAWIERFRHGAGLMFADAEILLVLGLAVGALGAAALWIALRLLGATSRSRGS